jgi:hypothetical protein
MPKEKRTKKERKGNGLSPIVSFIRFFEGINNQAWIGLNLLHLRPAKWYTFQLKSWYIIEPLTTSVK